MIALDFSGTVFSALYVDIAGGTDPHKEYIRHMVLNVIRAYNKKFRDEYGEMVICLDSKSWREGFYKFYKWERKNGRKTDSGTDWDLIFTYILEIQEEVKTNFPFPVIQIDGMEADDIMYHLGRKSKEKFLIISNDKDMVGATKFDNVDHYRPYIKDMFVVDDPERYEFDLIVSGDKTDGIPSIRCDDEFLKIQVEQREAGVPVMRAPPINVKLKDAIWEVRNSGDEAIEKVIGSENFKHFVRNRTLIDMSHTPKELVDLCEIELEHARKNTGSIMKCLTWMTSKRMNLLAREIGDFTPNLTPNKQPSLF